MADTSHAKGRPMGKVITIKCDKCNRKIFKYLKIGKGRLLHCWKKRILKDYSVRDGEKVKCQCGNVIGIDQGKWIKMCKIRN